MKIIAASSSAEKQLFRSHRFRLALAAPECATVYSMVTRFPGLTILPIFSLWWLVTLGPTQATRLRDSTFQRRKGFRIALVPHRLRAPPAEIVIPARTRLGNAT